MREWVIFDAREGEGYWIKVRAPRLIVHLLTVLKGRTYDYLPSCDFYEVSTPSGWEEAK